MLPNEIRENKTFLKKYGKDIQANIFTPHRKDHLLLLFLHLKNDRATRPMLQQVLNSFGHNSSKQKGTYLRSVKHQLNPKDSRKNVKQIFFNLFLTHHGLLSLGTSSRNWEPIITELKNNTQDLKQSQMWDQVYRESKPVHAVLLLAHDNQRKLNRKKAQLIKDYFPRIGIELLFEETGRIYRQKFLRTQRRGFIVEHFGYADGLSNPWITERDVRQAPNGFNQNAPVFSAMDFLVKEPGTQDKETFGSYFVYRKYEQHVDKFKKEVKRLAKKLKQTEDKTGALAIGRRRNGTSLEKPAQPKSPSEFHDFQFAPNGKCPVFAHARKVNPRKAGQSTPSIIRRGITYGDRKLAYGSGGKIFDRREKITHPVGLLFMSYQKEINTFQQLLKQCQHPPIDPILGHLDKPSKKIVHSFDGLSDPHEGFGGFASLKGGLNLFAPSISFFKNLKF